MRNTPDHTPETPSLGKGITGIRGAALAAILTIMTACAAERAGGHIEISNQAANVELEKLRRKFEHDTQKVRYGSNAEENAALVEILGRRDNLLESNGIPAGTERWYAWGDTSEGPYMGIKVDESACEKAPTCTVKRPGSKYPKIEEE